MRESPSRAFVVTTHIATPLGLGVEKNQGNRAGASPAARVSTNVFSPEVAFFESPPPPCIKYTVVFLPALER